MLLTRLAPVNNNSPAITSSPALMYPRTAVAVSAPGRCCPGGWTGYAAVGYGYPYGYGL